MFVFLNLAAQFVENSVVLGLMGAFGSVAECFLHLSLCSCLFEPHEHLERGRSGSSRSVFAALLLGLTS